MELSAIHLFAVSSVAVLPPKSIVHDVYKEHPILLRLHIPGYKSLGISISVIAWGRAFGNSVFKYDHQRGMHTAQHGRTLGEV